MSGPWAVPVPESSGGDIPPRTLLGCFPPVEDMQGDRVDAPVAPQPLSGLAAWFGGTDTPVPPQPTAKLEDPWCECDQVPNRPGSMTNRHVHWTCWQCGTEVIGVSVYGYTCNNCDVQQSAMSNCKPDPNFDYDAAALWLNP